MTKRRNALRLIGSILLVGAVVLSLYLYFQPREDIKDPFKSLNSEPVVYANLLSHVSVEPKAYFFCSLENADCLYTMHEVIEPLLVSANTMQFDQIHFVDISEIDANILPSALKQHLGFSRYPAFVMVSKVDTRLYAHSVYEWNDEQIFTPLGLKAWMVENGLWKTDYTN